MLERVPTNGLIRSLPRTARNEVLAQCEEVDLHFGTKLVVPGGRVTHVYFPIDSFISLVAPADGASSLEVGLIGNEGMHGASLALGVNGSPLTVLVQGQGRALRMTAAAFRRQHAGNASFRDKLNRYLYVLMAQLAQSATCARFHVVDARLARWLLMTQDRAHSDHFHITHMFLAWMLGVRRASVTAAANALQTKGILTYKRGDVTVLNRRGLEGCACVCYQIDRSVYRKVMGKAPADG